MKVPAFVLMRVEGWNREKKGVKRPSVSTEGQITEEAAPPRLEEGSLVLAMFLTA